LNDITGDEEFVLEMVRTGTEKKATTAKLSSPFDIAVIAIAALRSQ